MNLDIAFMPTLSASLFSLNLDTVAGVNTACNFVNIPYTLLNSLAPEFSSKF